MTDILLFNTGGEEHEKLLLTTNSVLSSHGIPVLRRQQPDGTFVDLGPADSVYPVGDTLASEVVEMWLASKPPNEEHVREAKRFLGQLPNSEPEDKRAKKATLKDADPPIGCSTTIAKAALTVLATLGDGETRYAPPLVNVSRDGTKSVVTTVNGGNATMISGTPPTTVKQNDGICPERGINVMGPALEKLRSTKGVISVETTYVGTVGKTTIKAGKKCVVKGVEPDKDDSFVFPDVKTVWRQATKSKPVFRLVLSKPALQAIIDACECVDSTVIDFDFRSSQSPVVFHCEGRTKDGWELEVNGLTMPCTGKSPEHTKQLADDNRPAINGRLLADAVRRYLGDPTSENLEILKSQLANS